MRGLLEFPEIFGESRDRGRRVENNLGAIESEHTGAFGKMTVVADVDTNFRVLRFENGITQIAGREIELLPEAGMHVRDVMFAIFAKVLSIGINHCCGVEIQTRHLFFVNRDDDNHSELRCDFLHEARRRSIGNAFRQVIPANILFGTKIRTVKKLLQAKNFHFFLGRLLDQLQVLLDHGVLDFSQRPAGAERIAGLNESTANRSGHNKPPNEALNIAELAKRSRLSPESFGLLYFTDGQQLRGHG